MLQLMRKHATSWFIKIIFTIIVIVFVLWGVGSFSNPRQTKVATVNGQPITIDEYREAYYGMLNKARETFGGQLNDNILEMLDLKNQALERLIDMKLNLQAAAEYGIEVSENELAAYISKYPGFQSGGQFQQARYNQVLRQYGMTPERFESSQKDYLVFNKLQVLLKSAAKVSSAEAREWYLWRNQQVRIDYALFEPGRYEDIDPSQEDLQAFYDAHKEKYKTPSELTVNYLRFSPQDYADTLTIEEGMLYEYYNRHQAEYEVPKTVHVRQIMLKTAADAAPEKVEEVKQALTDIRQKALDGADFAELAKAHSQDPSQESGGDLGFVARGDLSKPLSDAAFALEAGEISEPVRTDLGWHLLKAEEIHDAGHKPLESVRDEILAKVRETESRNMAENKAENLYETLYMDDNLSEVAKAQGLDLKTTDSFKRTPGPSGVANPQKFSAAAFALEGNQISEVLQLDDGFYLLQVADRKPGEIPPFSEITGELRSDLVDQRQDEKARADAEALLKALSAGGEFKAECHKLDVTPQTSEYLSRPNRTTPPGSLSAQVIDAAFQLNAQTPLPQQVVKAPKGYYVIRFLDAKAPADAEFEAQKQQIEWQLLKEKQDRLYENWLAGYKAASTIVKNESAL